MNFWILPLIHFLAVISPGPDFFLTLKHSLLHSRRASLISSFGIACGNLIQMAAALATVFFLKTDVKWVGPILKILGSTYLIFLGIFCLKDFFINFFLKKNQQISSKKMEFDLDLKNFSKLREKKNKKIQNSDFESYFFKGLLCNLFNPKAWAYFFSIFMSISTSFSYLEISVIVVLFYGITQGWFFLISILFTIPVLKSKLMAYQKIVGLITGIAFCVFGISLILN